MVEVPFLIISIVNGNPIPNKRLNKGPPKQALNPALGDPLFAIEVSAIMSPIEFPQASTVNPSMASLKPNMTPNALSKLTSSLAMM